MTRALGTFRADTRFLYTELAGAWLYFAFVEVIVLRLFDDLRLWRLLCLGMLLSDVPYFYSTAQAVGGCMYLDYFSIAPFSCYWRLSVTRISSPLLYRIYNQLFSIAKTGAKELMIDY